MARRYFRPALEILAASAEVGEIVVAGRALAAAGTTVTVHLTPDIQGR